MGNVSTSVRKKKTEQFALAEKDLNSKVMENIVYQVRIPTFSTLNSLFE